MDICIILGHGPFSHVFEDKVQDGILDDKDPKKKKLKASEANTDILYREGGQEWLKYLNYNITLSQCIAMTPWVRPHSTVLATN